MTVNPHPVVTRYGERWNGGEAFLHRNPQSAREANLGNTRFLEKVAFVLLWLLAFAMPSNSVVIPGFGTLSRAVGIVAFAAGVLAVLDSGRLRVPGIPHLLMTLFVAWVGMTYFWSFAPWRTRVAIITYVQILAMIWLVWQFAQTYREQVLLLRALVLGTYVSSIATILEYFQGSYYQYQRYAGAGFDPGELGMVLAISVPISLYLIVRERGKGAVWIYAGQLVLAASAILLTASRGPVIACCLGSVLILPFLARQLTGGQKVAAAALVVAAGVVAFFVVPKTSWSRLATIGQELRAGTLNQRTMIWQAGWQVFGDSPFRGVGVGAFAPSVQHELGMPFRGPTEVKAEHNVELVAHNTFLSVLVEQGIIGFGLFVAILIALIHCAFRLPVLERMFWLSYFLTWAVGASTLTYEDRKLCWLLFALLAAQAASQIPVAMRARRSRIPSAPRVPFGRQAPVPVRGSHVSRWS